MAKYNKLVRDNIPAIIERSGQIPVTQKLNHKAFLIALEKKLQEEVDEYLESGDLEEIADIMEVIESIVAQRASTMQEIDLIRQVKRDERGGFKQKTLLVEVIS